jgi:hypothetical protein
MVKDSGGLIPQYSNNIAVFYKGLRKPDSPDSFSKTSKQRNHSKSFNRSGGGGEPWFSKSIRTAL